MVKRIQPAHRRTSDMQHGGSATKHIPESHPAGEVTPSAFYRNADREKRRIATHLHLE
ncbi:hypothetical protein [Shimwellia pseudoproteus]|uniref:hypothetical protein n=1 Tax=Shimwellia pseudoproteus TaxID=570012 RepID=UPI0018EBD45B|nr:hypothetical protein [Shimwellia pseudoproteus]